MNCWLVGHGVDEVIAHQHQSINLTIVELVQQYAHRTDYIGQLRRLAHVAHRSNHVAAVIVEKGRGTATDRSDVDIDACIRILLHRGNGCLEGIDI